MNLAEVFVKAGIEHAHIIDDAFDPLPLAGLTAAAAQGFVDNLDDAQLDKLCNVLGVIIESDLELVEALQEAEHAAKLFEMRASFSPQSDELFEDYIGQQQAKRAQVDPLVAFLSDHGIQCETFGADYKADGTKEPQLLFIDLKLREAGPLTVDDAVQVVQRLQSVHGQCRPFVFLMSTLTTALPERGEEFRQNARLFLSQFESLEKKYFANPDELKAILSRYAAVLPRLRELHAHIEELGAAISSATQRVQATLRSLDLADYFVLHRNTVSIEKVGLGTYISELLLDYLLHEVEDAQQLWRFAKTLDEWKLEELPRSRFGLTHAAAKIYSGNLLHAPVRLESELERNLGPAQGYFYLGDIFFSAKELNESKPTRALVIATPACDLVRPAVLRTRTVFLCEGSVKNVTSASVPAGTDGIATVVIPNPKDPNKQLLIKWNKKKLYTWHEAEIDSFASAETCHWVRVGRLRPLYALQLQHAVAADLSRIGVQRAPNLLVPHGVQVLVSDGTKWKVLDNEEIAVPTAAALADSEDGKQTVFIIADPTVRRIRRKVADWLEKNHETATAKLLSKIVESQEFDQRLMYLEHPVPDKSSEGAGVDISAYPMTGMADLSDDESSAIAIVRPNVPSPYVSICGGQDVSETQTARLVVKLAKVSN